MEKANKEIRELAKENGVKLWQIAEVFGCYDGNFSRKLRKEFSPANKERAIEAIMALKEVQQ